MDSFSPIRQLPKSHSFSQQDTLVVFGEVFQRGYVNGIIDEAEKAGMNIIYSTVGRRDENQNLRPLTQEELREKQQPLINIPLEAGFDLTPTSTAPSPADQLKGIKLSHWNQAQLNWSDVEESQKIGRESFCQRVQQYLSEVEQHLTPGGNVIFVHTMAGGVPRAKIIMPAMNRVFKGHGDRFASSKEFWESDLGRLCDRSFMDVTANTFKHLIELSAPLRDKITQWGGRTSYLAYGYHGTEVLVGDEYSWQSYSPYLQGFAKLELENIAKAAWQQGIHASVFNAPEILTHSSSIFLGVEVCLYPLLGALKKEQHPQADHILTKASSLMKPEFSLEKLMSWTKEYLESDVIQRWSQFDQWPQHNGPEQMEKMRNYSNYLLDLHIDSKNMMTAQLSEVVFRACGKIMLRSAHSPQKPVWWIGHDAVARCH